MQQAAHRLKVLRKYYSSGLYRTGGCSCEEALLQTVLNRIRAERLQTRFIVQRDWHLRNTFSLEIIRICYLTATASQFSNCISKYTGKLCWPPVDVQPEVLSPFALSDLSRRNLAITVRVGLQLFFCFEVCSLVVGTVV